jgi:uncharacterized protein (TIGR03437 family)
MDLQLTKSFVAQLDDKGRLPLSLAGAMLLFDGRPAPILRVTNSEIDAVVPFEVQGQSFTSVQVNYKGTYSSAALWPLVSARPEIVRLPDTPQSFARLITGEPVTQERPAFPGEIISIGVSGLGSVFPGLDSTLSVTGAFPVLTLSPLDVTIGGYSAEIIFVGPMSGQAPELMQINLRIPEECWGLNEIVLSVGGERSQSGLVVPIEKRAVERGETSTTDAKVRPILER